MTMRVYMITQMIEIFCAYFILTLGLPALIFRTKLKNRKPAERILFYFLAGNFYYMTLVFLLELGHISNRFTLILGSVLPGAWMYIRFHSVEMKKEISTFLKNLKWLTERKVGLKTQWLKLVSGITRKWKYFLSGLRSLPPMYYIEMILVVALFAAAFYVYSAGIVRNYGYSVSDLSVHNSWINALQKNRLFDGGIYPMGFHTIIYYLSEVFGFEVYIVLSLFALVQDVCIFFALFLVLRNFCKARFLPYAAMLLYLLCDIWGLHTFERLGAALPQEFGMIFVFPTIYYGIRYLQYKTGENREAANSVAETDRTIWGDKWICLVGFAVGVDLCFSTHFYGIVAVGLFMIAAAIFYADVLLKNKCFIGIVTAGLLGLIVALLPMGICFLTGTPLENSMYWGVNVINGSMDNRYTKELQNPYVGSSIQNVETGTDSSQVTQPGSASQMENGIQTDEGVQGATKVNSGVFRRLKAVLWTLDNAIFNENMYHGGVMTLVAIFVLIGLGIALSVLREREYGSLLFTIALYAVFMSLLLTARDLGLPQLMDQTRTSIYFTYSVPFLFAMAIDGLLYLPTFKMESRSVRTLTSFLVLVTTCYVILLFPKSPYVMPGMEMNEAVTCITNIIRTQDNFTWTIVSANDRLQMGWEHGYHYEILDFLEQMEPYSKDLKLQIPTKKVYFFIEKIPAENAGVVGNRKEQISGTMASKALPGSELGTLAYSGTFRLICMSKLYFWMQDFREYFPNNVRVYLETDRFVCYEVEQNEDAFLNFAINYGFN